MVTGLISRGGLLPALLLGITESLTKEAQGDLLCRPPPTDPRHRPDPLRLEGSPHDFPP